MNKKVFVLGGDGFCGWPTALRLSNEGYDVTIIDNLSRRKIDIDLYCESLTPIKPIDKRLSRWKELTGKVIDFQLIDIALEYDVFLDLINEKRPDAIVHFAEQRSAPYSMKNSKTKRYTVNNNISVTHNVLAAIVESGLDIHLVHLGTMGVYGYGTAGISIPEGYLNVTIKKDGIEADTEILYPANPGSIYHTTKTLDALLFFYYNKNDKLRITDLHQGIVWGTNTTETKMHEDLVNRFDYDGDYGTVLNRFLMQAAIGHPLTIYGTGGQTRAFIHINNTADCISLALQNPPSNGERVKIFNQATETHTLIELAGKISKLTNAEIKHIDNPRVEDAKNNLKVDNNNFLNVGLNCIKLQDGLLEEVMEVAEKYKDRADQSKILPTSKWRK
ncbi:MAG: NAD-dependent epimerase/dehydratase family protein [Bacteroidia bacterium]